MSLHILSVPNGLWVMLVWLLHLVPVFPIDPEDSD